MQTFEHAEYAIQLLLKGAVRTEASIETVVVFGQSIAAHHLFQRESARHSTSLDLASDCEGATAKHECEQHVAPDVFPRQFIVGRVADFGDGVVGRSNINGATWIPTARKRALLK